MTSLATEDWAGTVAGWPAQWTGSGTGTMDRVSGQGRMTAPASFSAQCNQCLTGMSTALGTDTVVTFVVPNPKVNTYGVVGDRTNGSFDGSYPNSGYFVELDQNSNAYYLRRTVLSVTTLLATVPKTFTAGTNVKCRIRTIGCMVLCTVWNVGSGEPNPDLLLIDDAAPYLTAGKVSLTGLNGTGSAVDLFWDDLTVDDMAVTPYPYVVANRGSLANATAGTTSVITLSNPTAIAVGNYLFAYLAVDNTGAAGIATTCTVTDSQSNTWTVLTATNRTPGGATNDGSSGRWAYCKVTSAYVATNTVTFTWGNSSTAKAIEIIEVANVHATSPIAVSVVNANGTGTTPSVSITPTAANQLVLGLVSAEAPNADTWTVDSDTTDGPWGSMSRLGSTNATATNNQAVLAQAKVSAGTSAQTFNPTLGTSRDWAASIIVIAPPPANTPVSSSDTGSGADAVTKIGVTPAGDTGAGVDAGSIAAALTSTETGSGTEATPQIGISTTELGSGTDAGAMIGTSAAETGGGADTGSLAATLTSPEVGAGADAVGQIGLSAADTASGADAGAVTVAISSTDTSAGADAVGKIGVATTELGSGADAGTLIGTSAADTGSGADAGSVVVAVSSSDSGGGVDAVASIGVQATGDTGSGSDSTGAVAASVAGTDLGSGSDAVGRIGTAATETSAAVDAVAGIGLTNSDLGGGAETGLLAAALTSTDTGSGVDAGSARDVSGDSPSSSDTGSGSDAGSIQASLSSADTGNGLDTATRIGLTAAELAQGADQVARIGTSGSDTGAGADLAGIGLSGADSAAGADQASLAVTLNAADSATGIEGIPRLGLSAADIAGGFDEVLRIGVASGDVGHGIDGGEHIDETLLSAAVGTSRAWDRPNPGSRAGDRPNPGSRAGARHEPGSRAGDRPPSSVAP